MSDNIIGRAWSYGRAGRLSVVVFIGCFVVCIGSLSVLRIAPARLGYWLLIAFAIGLVGSLGGAAAVRLFGRELQPK